MGKHPRGADEWTNLDLQSHNVDGNLSVILSNGTAFDYKYVCYNANKMTSSGVWLGDSPLDYALPLLIFQLVLIVLLTRLLDFFLKRFGQPRVVAEILAGIILGPTGIGGNSSWFAKEVFPLKSILILQTMANVSLLFALFSLGVQMDLSVVRSRAKMSFVVALAGMGLPFVIAGASAFKFANFRGLREYEHMDRATFVLFFGVALTVTAFPVIARFIAELKLLSAELGRLAMSSAIVNDLLAWMLFTVAIILARYRQNVDNLNSSSNSHRDSIGGLKIRAWCVVISCIVFVGFCILVIRPGMQRIIRRTPEGESVSDFHLCLILSGVLFCAFLTDSLGTHAFFGAFLFGLVTPNGPLASNLIERLEDFLSGLLLPLFFVVCGLRTNIKSLGSPSSDWIALLVVTILSSLAKVAAILLTAVYHEMPPSEGVTLGLLMNIKGLNEMIVLNTAREMKVFKEDTFTLYVFVAVVTTAVVFPTVTAMHKPGGRFVRNKRRTIQKIKQDDELRLLVCIQNLRNVPSITRLLDISHPNKRSPIHVYALQLVELRGLASAMLIVHNEHKSGRSIKRTQTQSDQILNAFDIYEQTAEDVSFQHITATSAYSTMHEDICNLAEDKKVSLIIVPFHKQQSIDGGMEEPNPEFRIVNQNVLTNAPCSVGILIDRGLGASASAHNIVVLFFGGPDDREALTYALRMSNSPDVSLTVLRFIPGDEAKGWSTRYEDDSIDDMFSVITENEKERQMDDDVISAFRMKTSNDESIIYIEKVTNNGEETVSTIRSLDDDHDLYIVGRGQGTISPLTDGLSDWSDCPELGVIGDILASGDFALSVSVLVIQQYVGMGLHGDGLSSNDSPAHQQRDQLFERHPSRGPTNNYGGHGSQPWQQVDRY